MVVLDAAALIAVMKDEPAADAVGEILQGPTTMSAVNYCEVVDHLLRVVGADPDWVDLSLAPIISTSLDILTSDAEIAEDAAQVRAHFYDSRERPVSLADCFAIATARKVNAPLATSDRAVAAILVSLGQEVVRLPNSRGAYPN